MQVSPKTLARLLIGLACLGVWLIALLAVLKVSQVDLGLPHGICGPWGCGPKLEALIACHGFWLLLLGPPAAYAASRSSIGALHRVSLSAMAVGVAAIVTVIIWQASDYLPLIDTGAPSYFLQRCLFVIAITVEFPMLQLLLLGVIGWIYADGRKKRFVRAQRRSVDEEADGYALNTRTN